VPYLLSAAAPPQRPPPLLGEHADAILTEAGLTPSEIAALKRSGIVPSIH
jgi:alpha-methylacyl-CoA racemase